MLTTHKENKQSSLRGCGCTVSTLTQEAAADLDDQKEIWKTHQLPQTHWQAHWLQEIHRKETPSFVWLFTCLSFALSGFPFLSNHLSNFLWHKLLLTSYWNWISNINSAIYISCVWQKNDDWQFDPVFESVLAGTRRVCSTGPFSPSYIFLTCSSPVWSVISLGIAFGSGQFAEGRSSKADTNLETL